jgi:hypothetical protein
MEPPARAIPVEPDIADDGLDALASPRWPSANCGPATGPRCKPIPVAE